MLATSPGDVGTVIVIEHAIPERNMRTQICTVYLPFSLGSGYCWHNLEPACLAEFVSKASNTMMLNVLEYQSDAVPVRTPSK